MMKSTNMYDLAMWLSGFFGLGALVHLVRSVSGANLIIADYNVPLMTSVLIAVIGGVFSIALLIVALKRHRD